VPFAAGRRKITPAGLSSVPCHGENSMTNVVLRSLRGLAASAALAVAATSPNVYAQAA